MDFTRFPIPTKAFIGGKYVDSLGNQKQTLQSAVDERVITTELQWSNADDVNFAVAESEKGLAAWKAMSKGQRSEAMRNFAKLLLENSEEMAWLEAVVTGKPVVGAGGYEIPQAAEIFCYYAAKVDEFQSEVLETSNTSLSYVLRQPYGVTAGIIPFNGPVYIFALTVAPALAAGNAITVKASEQNPLSLLFAASLSVKAGIPAGALNMLTGGAVVGQTLAAHMKVRKISFTGSVGVGKAIQVAAAQSNLKSVTLELGGKSPLIIFPDADLDRAAQTAAMGFLSNNGQVCVSSSRLYVHRDVVSTVLAKVKAHVEAYEKSLGADPLSLSTISSPMFTMDGKKRVQTLIQSGEAEAELFYGGSGNVLDGKGAYVRPTVFVKPKPDARVLNEEIFGPVLTVVEFDDEEEVLAMANNTELGLAAAVFTASIPRALRFSRELEAGTVGINVGTMALDVARPFGGWKQSGQGIENGRDGLLDWTQIKTVNIA